MYANDNSVLQGAVIGCGFFAENHLHAWRDIDNAQIVAICDTDPVRLAVVGEQFNIERRYHTAEELFSDDGFDFVDIATTVPSHQQLVQLAASNRTPMICQKPFAADLATAQSMVAAAAAAAVPLMVHENFRWQSAIRAVRSMIDNQRIGEPFWGRFSFRSAYDVFSGQPYLAEGKRFIIEDLGIHILDIARYMMGEVTQLTARTDRVNPNIVGEDVATILMDHVSGRTSVVDCSYATHLSKEPFPETLIEIDGSKGSLRLRQGYQLDIVSADQKQTIDVSPPLLPWASKPWHNIQESVLAIQQHWIESLVNRTQPDTSGEDNLQTLALVEAAYRSAETRQPVLLNKVQ